MSRVQPAFTTTVGDQGQIESTQVQLPEVWAWAHRELAGYSDAEIDEVLCQWCSAPKTRSNLLWMEDVLARQRSMDSGQSAKSAASTFSGGSGAALSTRGGQPKTTQSDRSACCAS